MSIIEKLAAIQSELKAPKSQFNSFGKYKYRNCEDILEALKPLLARHKCVVLLSDKVNAIGSRFYIEATATLQDAKESISVTASAREEEVKKGMDSAQISGACSSYSRKYSLSGLFCIDDNRDADSEKPVSEGEKKKLNEDAVKAKIKSCADRPTLEKMWIEMSQALKTSPDIKKAFVIRGSELDEAGKSIEDKNTAAEKANVSKHIEQAKTLEDLEEVKDFVKAFDLVQVYNTKKQSL